MFLASFEFEEKYNSEQKIGQKGKMAQWQRMGTMPPVGFHRKYKIEQIKKAKML